MSAITSRCRDGATVSSIATPDSTAPVTASVAGGRPVWKLIRRSASGAVVVVTLAGVAVWGQMADWKLPKFSKILGSEAAEESDWCEQHNVPDSRCIECKPWLLPADKDYGWCLEHGVAQCPLHHPDVAQLAVIPKISAADLERADRALALLPRAENGSRCKLHLRRIQFASNEAVEKAGIDIAVVDERSVVEAVTANGELVYDQTRSAHLASRVAGTVWRVEKHVGDQVHSGDILALIDAADVGKAKSELLQSIAERRLKQTNVERLKPLAEDGTIPGRQLREAEAALEEAKIRLLGAQQALVNLGLPVRADDFAELNTDQVAERIRLLGIPAALTTAVDNSTTTSNLFPLRSPLDGTVVECKTVAGEAVAASAMIFGVANVEHMWLVLD
ncbi:MAG TPA: efflux RND transporter periplasmic adaptor subunit, partial [Pirellulales bacterium]|nr:efflux RND transporter periplasmic adaptor subunit [Pirellulales bacterium]